MFNFLFSALGFFLVFFWFAGGVCFLRTGVYGVLLLAGFVASPPAPPQKK